jgi:hypothetical protein
MNTTDHQTPPTTIDQTAHPPDVATDNSPGEEQAGDSKCTVQRPSYRLMLEAAQMAKSTGSDQPRKSALFVAHGMGQQLKYATLDQIAQELLEKDARVRGGKSNQPDTEAITIQSDNGLMWGIKLLLQGKDKVEREVHIFEGYWAPLTEGEVTLRDVIAFLFTAGLNGLRNGRAKFNRWLFGRYCTFQASLTVTLYLIAAVAGVASLVAMNTALVTVAAFSSPFTNSPEWLPGLKRDLTVTFNIFVFFAVLLGLSLGIASRARAKRRTLGLRKWLTKISLALFALTLGATILCGLAIALLFYGHIFRAPERRGFWEMAFGSGAIELVNYAISLFIVAVILMAVALLLFGKKKKRSRSGWLSGMKRGSALMLIGAVVVFGSVATTIFFLAKAVFFTETTEGQFSWQSAVGLINGISWPLLIAVSWLVRRLLVQYVGDVAVYITPHTLDRFNSLREKIRKTVVGAAKAVYATRRADGQTFEYDDVFIVGHSLGSVIVYDTLNWLINEDEFHQSTNKLCVAQRTRLLLTFGSPLDKIAFLFALQKEKTSEEREALVGASQPLIQQPEFRQFDWINLHSPNDIISGDLNFYDPPKSGKHKVPIKRVTNEIDPQATTLLAAHIEYWENPLLFKTLYEKLMS